MMHEGNMLSGKEYGKTKGVGGKQQGKGSRGIGCARYKKRGVKEWEDNRRRFGAQSMIRGVEKTNRGERKQMFCPKGWWHGGGVKAG